MTWSKLKQLAQQQLKSSSRAQSYVRDYRKIPLNVLEEYGVGAIRPQQLLDLSGLSEEQIGALNGLQDIEWISAFMEDLDGNPLAVELRSIGTGRSFYKLFLPLAKVHPVFFGMPQALKYLDKKRWCAIVEGIFEALSFASISKFPVLGLLTKDPTNRQARWLRRWCEKLTLFLNADERGQAATKKWLASKHWPGVVVVDSQWYECPNIDLGASEDLNELLQQQGQQELRNAMQYGLKR